MEEDPLVVGVQPGQVDSENIGLLDDGKFPHERQHAVDRGLAGVRLDFLELREFLRLSDPQEIVERSSQIEAETRGDFLEDMPSGQSSLFAHDTSYVYNMFLYLDRLFSDYYSRDSGLVPWGFFFQPDPGRSWPPIGTDWMQTVRSGLAVSLWLVFLGVAPYLLRLRRRAGRWMPRAVTFGS